VGGQISSWNCIAKYKKATPQGVAFFLVQGEKNIASFGRNFMTHENFVIVGHASLYFASWVF